MATLHDLINAIDIDDIKFQLLSQGHLDLVVRGRKDKYLEVKFHTDADHIVGKEALVIWVDKQKFDDALNSVKGK